MNIEQSIKQIKSIIKIRKEQKEIIELGSGYCANCKDDIEALETLLLAYEKEKEKIENQKKELAILNEKQKEFNKLVNTVSSYKGQFKRQQKELEELKKKNETARERLEYYLIENMALDDIHRRDEELRKIEKILEGSYE